LPDDGAVTGHSDRVTTLTDARLRPATLTRGQVVTVLVGLGLDLCERHATGTAFGPVHPAHVRIGPDGRPVLARGIEPPPGWTPHDDWVGLLRFGRAMGRPQEAGVLSWWSAGRLEGTALLRWLVQWAEPVPLDRDGQPC
jgi:hypothetical protein